MLSQRSIKRHDCVMTENPPENQPPATPSTYPTSTDPASTYPTSTYPTSTYPTSAPSEPLAIWALVCAIGSWVLLPVVLAIVALVLASQAKRTIAASGGATSGEGLVTAARVIAWVHLALVVLAVIFVIAFAVGLVLSN